VFLHAGYMDFKHALVVDYGAQSSQDNF